MSQVVYLVRHCQATSQAPDAPLTTLGQQQALELANRFEPARLERIVSSPFTRTWESITPLAERHDLAIEVDNRLVERVLSPNPLENWQVHLAATFKNLDLMLDGGESSRSAMMRGVAVVDEIV